MIKISVSINISLPLSTNSSAIDLNLRVDRYKHENVDAGIKDGGMINYTINNASILLQAYIHEKIFSNL